MWRLLPFHRGNRHGNARVWQDHSRGLCVIDDEERFNQQDFADTLTRVAEMGDMVARFLIRVL